MSPAVAELVKAALALSEPEREELVEAIAGLSSEEIALPPELVEELERRLNEHDQNPGSGYSWDEVKTYFRSCP